MKSRPDNHETARAIVRMNKEARQYPQTTSRRNKCRDDLVSEKLEWLIWLSHNWKWSDQDGHEMTKSEVFFSTQSFAHK